MTTTMKQLESLVSYLNKITNHAATPYTQQPDGKFTPNAGNYHLSGAYGGHKLDQMCETGTGTRDVLNCGFTTKSNLYNLINAYIRGIEVKS